MKFEGRANEGGVPPNAVSPSGQRKSTPLAPLILLSLVLGAGCNSKKGAEMPPSRNKAPPTRSCASVTSGGPTCSSRVFCLLRALSVLSRLSNRASLR